MKLKLPSGVTYGIDNNGNRVCTGTQMGRRNILPADPKAPIKLRLQRLPFVDQCYDRWGAYWGSPANVWCAWGEDSEIQVFVFVRADSRTLAKQGVVSHIPGATFYR